MTSNALEEINLLIWHLSKVQDVDAGGLAFLSEAQALAQGHLHAEPTAPASADGPISMARVR
jgi:hypothetical protein